MNYVVLAKNKIFLKMNLGKLKIHSDTRGTLQKGIVQRCSECSSIGMQKSLHLL